MVQSSASLPVIASPTTLPTAAICPYLLAADERWRSASPAREHRCTAVAPASILSIEKQRRLCLAVAHGRCATYAAAIGLEAQGAEPPGAAAHGAKAHGGPAGQVSDTPRRASSRTASRPLARTAPTVMDHGRLPVTVRGFRPDRGVAQLALLVLMIVAFAAIVLARVSAPSPAGGVLGGISATGSPATTSDPGSSALIPTARPTSAPSGAAATGGPAPTDAEAPGATGGPTTYTVRRGDTLSGIAAEFGTTVGAVAERNGIDDPSRLRIGQVLEIP